MGTLVKNEFRTHAARQFIESIDEASNTIYYISMGKPQGYSESTTPAPTNSITNNQYQVWDEMVLGKQVTATDTKHKSSSNAALLLLLGAEPFILYKPNTMDSWNISTTHGKHLMDRCLVSCDWRTSIPRN